jgi:GAF domain-containing protein
MEYLKCRAFFNYLVDEQSGGLRLHACAGISLRDAESNEWLDYGAAIYERVAVTGKPFIAENILSGSEPENELLRSCRINAYVCHALLGPAGKVMGTLSFGSAVREAFQTDDIELMQAVADQVAIAVSRSRDEELLRRSEKRLFNILNSITDSLIALDAEWRFLEVNAAAEREVFNQPASDLIGKVFWDIYPRTKDGAFREHYEKAVRERRAF